MRFNYLWRSMFAFWRQSRARRQLFLEARGRLGAIVESSLDAIISQDLDGVVTSWNPAAAELFGFSREEALGRKLVDLIVPVDLEPEEARTLAMVRAGRPLEMPDTERIRKDGSVVPVSVTVAPILDQRGATTGASTTLRDITLQKQAAHALARANEELELQVKARTEELTRARRQLQGVLDGVPSMIGYWNRDLINQVANHAYHSWYGVSPEALPGTHLRDLLGERVYLEILPYAQAALAGVPQTFERQLMAPDGRLHDVLGHYLPDWIDGQVAGFYAIAHDVSDLADSQRRLHAALAESKGSAAQIARLNSLLSGVLDSATEVSVIATNKDGMIELFNRGAERMLGYGAQELIGARTPAILCDEREIAARAGELSDQLARPISGFETLVALALVQGAETRVWTCRRKNGSTFPISLTVTAIRDEAGAVAGFLGIGFDVSRQREVEESLLLAKNLAEQASRSKSQFVANMSHEIRTPMNAVLGLLQVLQRTGLDAEQLDCVNKASQAGKTLLGLINDVLDYSKLEAEHLILDQHNFDLEAMLQDVVAAIAGARDKAQLDVMVDASPRLPQALVGDSLRLSQVLLNLMGNAIKFTVHGHVLLRVECMGRHDGHERLRFSVSDTGIGIPDSQREQVFGEFTQAESSTTRRFGGTGLGLAICRRLVALMGGTLQLESAEGIGSRFWFEVDLLARPQAPLPDASHGPMVATAPNPAMRELLARLLPELGWQADIVSGQDELLARVLQQDRAGKPYRLALLGAGRRGAGAAAMAEAFQQLEVKRRPALVLLAAPDQGTGLDLPCLAAPFTAGQLAEVLQAAARDSGAPAPPAVARPELRLAGMRILVVEDQALNRMVAERLLCHEGAAVLTADGGASGVAIANRHAGELDVILMDLQMPDMDGISATRAIQSNRATAHIPVIAMTANASVMDRKACLKAGMVDHIGKPIDIEHVVQVLTRRISLSLARPGPTQAAPAGAERLEAMDGLLLRYGGSLEVYRMALAQFEASAGEILDALEGHCAKDDRERAAGELHALKGLAGMLGASGYAAQCATMERALKDGATVAAICGAETRLRLRAELTRYAEELLARLPAQPGDTAPLRRWLDEIQTMLDFGSMDALDKLAGLLPELDDGLRPEVAAAMDAVSRLQFERAAAVLARVGQALETE